MSPQAPARRRRGADEGATAVEFALIAPVFLALMLGLIEIGRLAWSFHTLQYAVQETARRAMVYDSDSLPQLTAYLRERAPGGEDVVSVTLAEEVEDEILYLTIRAELRFELVTGFLPIGPLTLPARARVPRPPGG